MHQVHLSYSLMHFTCARADLSSVERCERMVSRAVSRRKHEALTRRYLREIVIILTKCQTDKVRTRAAHQRVAGCLKSQTGCVDDLSLPSGISLVLCASLNEDEATHICIFILHIAFFFLKNGLGRR